MTLLISLFSALLFVLLFNNLLRKKAVYFYMAAILTDAFSVFVSYKGILLPVFVTKYVMPVISGGGLAGALFIIVMITGALPNGSKAMKLLMPVRGELSIIASILTLGHNISYGKTYFVMLFKDFNRLPLNQTLAAICSLVMLVIMLPLFVTSFKCIRKKMKPVNWKRLQRFAYGFYGLLWLHLMLLLIPSALKGKTGSMLSVCLYCAVFLIYLLSRIAKKICIRRKCRDKLAKAEFVITGVVCTVFVLICIAGLTGNDAKTPDTQVPAAKAEATGIEAGATDVRAEAAGVEADVTEAEIEASGAEAEDRLSLDLMAETAPGSSEINNSNYTYKDGVFTGKGFGNSGYINVEITLKEDLITAVRILDDNEDEPYRTMAMELLDAIISENSVELDAVAGATYTSMGILDAVNDALNSAKN